MENEKLETNGMNENEKTEEKEKKKGRFRNPVIKRMKNQEVTELYDLAATTKGAAIKSLLLLALVIAATAVSYVYVISTKAVLMTALVAFLTGLYLCYHPETSPCLAPIYAVLEGIVLGQVSVHEETACNGIVLQAVLITFGLALLIGISYCHRWFKVNKAFRSTVILVTGALALLYLTDLVLIFGFDMNIPLLHDMGWKGIICSMLAIFIASGNLALDFADIDTLTEKGLPEYYEWYFAFGFMVSLIWIYLEVLNMLRKARK